MTPISSIPEAVRPILEKVVREAPHPLLFATVSGAHLYGFPSPDSDYDLRGVHVLPKEQIVGLTELRETIEVTEDREGIELDLVTHDVKKFFSLMLKKNGYVQEQLLSPIVVHAGPGFEELRDIAPACVTRHHSHHYFGFSQTQWELALKETPTRVKPLLYVYRVLLTGIKLMRTGTFEMNLLKLNEEFRLGWLDELVRAKREGHEKIASTGLDLAFHQKEYERLRVQLEESFAASALPNEHSALPRLNDLLVRIRLGTVK